MLELSNGDMFIGNAPHNIGYYAYRLNKWIKVIKGTFNIGKPVQVLTKLGGDKKSVFKGSKFNYDMGAMCTWTRRSNFCYTIENR